MIVESDVISLIKVPGMGKKSAERVLLELKDKVEVDYLSILEASDKPQSNICNESIDALVSLGFSKKESEDVINKIIKTSDLNIELIKVENLIKMALLDLK